MSNRLGTTYTAGSITAILPDGDCVDASGTPDAYLALKRLFRRWYYDGDNNWVVLLFFGFVLFFLLC